MTKEGVTQRAFDDGGVQNCIINAFLLLLLSSRWFRHITEASNAYKSRESSRRSGGRGSSALGHGSDAHHAAANGGLSLDAGSSPSRQAESDVGKPAARSQSFHESGSSAGAEAGDEDSLVKKTGKEERRPFLCHSSSVK